MRFVKMSGAGNDFVLLDPSDPDAPALMESPADLRALCVRGLGVGADGVILLRPDPAASFGMSYRNSDGSPAAMCGNGARCATVFAVSEGLAPSRGSFSFRSDAGLHRAEATGPASARIWLTDPVPLSLAGRVILPGRDPSPLTVSLVDTGVPHAVLFPPDSLAREFETEAPLLRVHEGFGPAGANVDFAVPEGRSSLSLRTWERGVEGETLACGTGAVAAVFCGFRLGLLDVPCRVRVRSGLVLGVGKDDHGWWLEGEARMVFSGELLPGWSVRLTEDA